MEVTKYNFIDVLPEIQKVVESSLFLAVDGEFTGLLNLASNDINAFDTPPVYYEKVRKGSTDYLLIQFGICAFIYDEKLDRIVHRAYNFYIFPNCESKSGKDHHFLCQSSSLAFLASHGFDFNKLIRDGIPYMTQTDEDLLRENLKEKQTSRIKNYPANGSTSDRTVPIPEEHAKTIEDICTGIDEFLEDLSVQEVELGKFNSFVRMLAFQTVHQKYDRRVRLDSRIGEDRYPILVASRIGDPEEEANHEAQRCKSEWKEFEAAVGFTKIIRLISHSGKLVVGHNMLLDILHVLHQFCSPLPEDYLEFKELSSCVFPKLLDTKYLASCPGFKELVPSSVLPHLQKTLSEAPFHLPDVGIDEGGCGYAATDSKLHEAGYDAYMTGRCLVSMCNYLGTLRKPAVTILSQQNISTLLEKYINKLFLQRSYLSPYMNISGDDGAVNHDNVFHVTFPKEWKTHDIHQLFSPYGSIYCGWIDDVSAFVSLNQRDQVEMVLRTMTQSSNYKLMTYAAYQRSQAKEELGDTRKCAIKTVPSSPTTVQRKRRSLELIRSEDAEMQTPSSVGRRAHNIGDVRFPKRSIDPIPEDDEVEEASVAASLKGEGGGASTPELAADRATSKTKKVKLFEETAEWE